METRPMTEKTSLKTNLKILLVKFKKVTWSQIFSSIFCTENAHFDTIMKENSPTLFMERKASINVDQSVETAWT